MATTKTDFFEAVKELESAKRLPTIKVVSRADWGSYVRYSLSNGWFIDKAVRHGNESNGYKFGAWAPGGSPTGHAAFIAGANGLRALLVILNKGSEERRVS